MSTCPTCQGPMKPLFVGFYCPKDCDKPKAEEPIRFEGARLFTWKGERWRGCKVDKTPPGSQTWFVSAGELDLCNMSQDEIDEYGERMNDINRAYWADKPGWQCSVERKVRDGMDLWLFTKEGA